MLSLNVLYLGPLSGTCLDRANALRRLGHEVEHVDLRLLLPKSVWIDRAIWKIGGDWLSAWLKRALPRRLQDRHYELCYVDGGELVTSDIIALLRRHARKVINYCIDDPLGPRDGARSRAYRQSVASYDLCVVMREQNVAEARAMGARDVYRVLMSADEVSHAPRSLTRADHLRWDSDVLFLGTWFPERGPFLMQLVELGVPLTIRGSNWSKAPEWQALRKYWQSGQLHGDDYAKAIQCARVNLGLLSKGNRDMHTTRSMEVPALGSMLCAERTAEHTAMYEEGREALFWSDAAECAAKCQAALHDEGLRLSIAAAGRVRLQKNAHYNEQVLAAVLQRAGYLHAQGSALQ